MVIYIFATRSDLVPGIEWIEAQKDLHYVIDGLFYKDEINEMTVWDSLKNVKEIGYNVTGQCARGTQFLVVERKHKIKIEKVKQRKGGYLYAIDPLKNPHSITFQPNGIYQDRYLIQGNIGTVSESKKSIELYKFFSRGIVKGFKRIEHRYYVGPEAMKLAESGVRLITMHTQEDRIYDLRVERNLTCS